MSSATPPLIQGKFVTLREMCDADAEHVVAWRNLPDIARWLVDSSPLSVDRHLRYVAMSRQRGDAVFMLDSPAGLPVGTVSLYNLNPQRSVIELGRLCKGRGSGLLEVMREGLHLAHRFGFELIGIQRVFVQIAGDNTSCIRLGEDVGYLHEGRRRQHFHTPTGLCDVVDMGLLRAEFDSFRPKFESDLYAGQQPPELTPAAHEYAARLRAACEDSSTSP